MWVWKCERWCFLNREQVLEKNTIAFIMFFSICPFSDPPALFVHVCVCVLCNFKRNAFASNTQLTAFELVIFCVYVLVHACIYVNLLYIYWVNKLNKCESSSCHPPPKALQQLLLRKINRSIIHFSSLSHIFPLRMDCVL